MAWLPLAGQHKCFQNGTSVRAWLYATTYTHTGAHTEGLFLACWNIPCLPQVGRHEVLQRFTHSPLLINTHIQYTLSMWKAPGYWVLPLTCFHWIVLCWVSCINMHAYLHIASACLCISVHTLLLSLAVREGERSGLALRIEWDTHINCLPLTV